MKPIYLQFCELSTTVSTSVENLAPITHPNPQEAQVGGYLVCQSPSRGNPNHFRLVDSVDSVVAARCASERSCGKPNTRPYTKINQGPPKGLYQAIFKVNRVHSLPVETAPILTEGYVWNNELQSVIHRLASRESWVFHTIHNFCTNLASQIRKAVSPSGKPQTSTTHATAIDTHNRVSV